jgi:plastocyanin
MGTVGKVAFPVILALGALTGYLTYTYFYAAIPKLGFVESPYRTELPPAPPPQTTNTTSDESKFSKIITIDILKGANVQGNPDYGPKTATATSDALIKWINKDIVPHTATSGKSSSDPDSGKLFDSSYLDPGKSYSVPASKIGPGTHQYYCQVHPYMSGTITIQ